jgi:hypothetical protein
LGKANAVLKKVVHSREEEHGRLKEVERDPCRQHLGKANSVLKKVVDVFFFSGGKSPWSTPPSASSKISFLNGSLEISRT